MKKIFIFSALSLLLFSSCGINNAFILNQNQNATQVQLASSNFKVTDRVSGSAEVKYICMIGGMNKKQLFENAYAAMVNKAALTGSSRALANIVTEEHIGGFPPFYFKRTITVTAHIVEFTR